MRISIIGYEGIVGNATYELLRRLGHEVVGSDKTDPTPLANLYVICTPEDKVETVIQQLNDGRKIQEPLIIRSTVLPGTCERLAEKYDIHIIHLPEFMREATAVFDVLNPARIVIGECCPEHGDLIEKLLKPLLRPIIRTNPITSELTKLASNACLACQISYWNSIEEIAKRIGVCGHEIGNIASMDPRISSYGARMHNKYGGKCLPKDIRHLIEFSQKIGYEPILFKAVEQTNEQM